MKPTLFITGATNGTGYATARRFAREGYDVFLTSRDAARAEEAARRLSEECGVFARGYGLDIRDEQAVIDIFQDIDRQGCFVSTLVLNAADLGFGQRDLFTVPIEDFQRVLETNMVWNFMIARQAALRMREQGRGSIVFISSATADRAIPSRTAYCASKGGINSLCKALAVDLGVYGIRCNCVLPGTIKTERWENAGRRRTTDGSMVPLGDISDFEDIANAAWYFGSDESKNVTGAELTVDGGMTCQFYPPLLDKWKLQRQEEE